MMDIETKTLELERDPLVQIPVALGLQLECADALLETSDGTERAPCSDPARESVPNL